MTDVTASDPVPSHDTTDPREPTICPTCGSPDIAFDSDDGWYCIACQKDTTTDPASVIRTFILDDHDLGEEATLAALDALVAELAGLRAERAEAEAWLQEHMGDDEDDYSFADLLARLFRFGDQGFGEAGRMIDENARLRGTVEQLTAALTLLEAVRAAAEAFVAQEQPKPGDDPDAVIAWAVEDRFRENELRAALVAASEETNE